jgi:D-arabinose 1-dehydrogenase-like Zn-dependent alcohol dehydrogenase
MEAARHASPSAVPRSAAAALAHKLNIQPRVSVFPLDQANEALMSVKDETENGSTVIVP